MTPTTKYGVRRFCQYRYDGRCFELYDLATGECASFPGTKKDLTAYLKTLSQKGPTR